MNLYARFLDVSTERDARMSRVLVAHSDADLQPSTSIRALLFDLDGTLVDSKWANLAAYNTVLGRLGIHLPDEWYSSRFALPAPQLLAEVRRDWSMDFDIATFVRLKNDAYLDLAGTISVFPVTSDVLFTEKGRWKLAVVTSSPIVTAEAVLEATGLGPCIDTLVTRDDVAATKPAPNPYLLAAYRLRIAPARCLAYEDADIGIESANRAGVTAIDVRAVCVSS